MIIPISARFSLIPNAEPFQILGIVSEDATEAILVAYQVASNLESCKKLKTKKVVIQVADLLGVTGTSIGLAALYALITLCCTIERNWFHAVTGVVNIDGGIVKISGVSQKVLISERNSVPIILPYGNKTEYEDLELSVNHEEPCFLSNVEQLVKLLLEDKKFVEADTCSLFTSVYN